MGNQISELASYMQPKCTEFLDKVKAAGIPCTLIDTGRTVAEQAQKIALGVSWTVHSKHEPQPPEMKSEAFDVCPTSLMATKLWSPKSPLWQQIGAIGESLGLFWGGRWTHLNNGAGDPGHFQWIPPKEPSSV